MTIELQAAYERIDELKGALNGLLGLLVLLANREDVGDELREAIHINHRVIAAEDAVDDLVLA